MSEKRFSPVEGMSCLLVGDKGVGISAVEACDLLNSQSETIEVLREWIQNTPINDDYDTIEDFEEMLVKTQMRGGCVGMETRVELAKRRIAALEGK